MKNFLLVAVEIKPLKKTTRMKKQILFLLILLWTGSSFRMAPASWKAILKLEGKGKNFVFTSDAVYGGLQPGDQKIFLFGKNHMFLNPAEPEATKVFHDLCVTNAMQQFQFEVLGVPSGSTAVKGKTLSGNISMRKRKPLQAEFKTIQVKGSNSASIETSGLLSTLGFTFTPEAEKLFTGKYTLTFVSSN
jgi:hypothetical protein